MKWMGAAVFALTTFVAGPAAIAGPVYLISGTSTITNDWEYLDVDGVDANAPAVGILFTVAADSPTKLAGPSQTVLVLCDDLFHVVYVPESYTPPNELSFQAEPLSGNSYYTGGAPGHFTPTQASELGQLVVEAQNIYGGVSTPSAISGLGLSEDQEIAAIQGAIWGIEYGKTVTDNAGNITIDDAIVDLRDQTFANGDGIGLYSDNGTQNQLLGFVTTRGGGGSPSPTPEPATWAMMLLGVFAAGFVLRRGSTPQLRAIAATA